MSLRTFKVRAYDASQGDNVWREFTIDAHDAADAVTIFEYRHRRRQLMPAPNAHGQLLPALSEPFDVIPVSKS